MPQLREVRYRLAEPAGSLASELIERPAWHALAACRGRSDDLFPSGRGRATRHRKRREAVCDACHDAARAARSRHRSA